MLVYANALQIVGSDAFRATAGAIHGWLTEQLGQKLSLADILRPGQRRSDAAKKSAWLRTYAATGEDPEMYAWRLKHVDGDVSGRQWLVEIGMKQEREVIDFSCTVQTEEMSVLITQPVMASRPRLLGYLLDNLERAADAEFASETPGLAIKAVGADRDSYRGLLGDIERPERDYPIVLVSPDRDGVYMIGPSHLQDAVLGLAQVVQVDPGFNSWDMEEALGRHFSAWGGAVNIIRSPDRDGHCRASFALSREVEEWGGTQKERIAAVLARVTHNTNIPRLREQIQPEGVATLALRRRLATQRERLRDNAGSEKDMIQLLEDGLDELTGENERLQAGLDNEVAMRAQLQQNWERLDQELRTERYKNRQLLAQGPRTQTTTMEVGHLLDLASRADQPSPQERLEVIAQAYPDRVVVLDTAYESAADRAGFDSGRRLLGLLYRLCTSFRDGMMTGGDDVARKRFTNSEYAATESESTQNNAEMRQKRTFVYDGKSVGMLRHLKIGIADDQRKSIRVYFGWVPEEAKIVIGHCGEHLPIISH